jgi:hypothetical protein
MLKSDERRKNGLRRSIGLSCEIARYEYCRLYDGEGL